MNRIVPVIFTALMLAGCTGETPAGSSASDDLRTAGGAQRQPVAVPHRESILDRELTVVEAGSYRSWGFSLPAAGSASYEVERRDGSSFSVCIIDDKEEKFLEAGQSVRGYECHRDVASASDTASLAAGQYHFVIWCENAFADCDLAASLIKEYTTYE